MKIELHPSQMEVLQNPKRFKIVVAGRQWGKSTLAVWSTILGALRTHNESGQPLDDAIAYYVGPAYDQVRRIVWHKYMRFAGPVIRATNVNAGTIELINGRRIYLSGSDRPDTLRGPTVSDVVLDEYADMRPHVWEQIIRPALTAVRGRALFIGTPKGYNHFHDLWVAAEHDPNFARWSFPSSDNPFLPPEELRIAREQSHESVWQQEYCARFVAGGYGEFKKEWLIVDPEEPTSGQWYVAIDLGGFSIGRTAPIALRTESGDNTAIAVVKVHKDGWWVREIQAGRWSVAETVDRIMHLATTLRPRAIGIERDRLLGALYPALLEAERRLGVFPPIEGLSHRGIDKQSRIRWALQGRFAQGQIRLAPGPWLRDFEAEYMVFPDKRSRDDRLDALAYIAHLAKDAGAAFNMPLQARRWEPLDREIGI